MSLYITKQAENQKFQWIHEKTVKLYNTRVSHLLMIKKAGILISTSEDGEINSWNSTNGLPIQVLAGHSWPVTGLVYSPEDKYLISSAIDGSIIVRKMKIASLNDPVKKLNSTHVFTHLQTIKLSIYGITSLAYDSRSQLIVAGRIDGSIQVFEKPKKSEIFLQS